jgi:hypothetical protein
MRGAARIVWVGLILGGCAAQPGDAGIETQPSGAAPADGGLPAPACPAGGEPALDSAQFAGAFVQIRQGAEDELVLTGDLLQRVTAVTVGELPATIISQDPHQLRAHLVVPHGTAPGPRPVSVGDGSCATLDDAIEVTPVVAAATGAWSARGTFESPFFSNSSAAWDAPAAGDTVLLLAGEHAISARLFIDAGVRVEGAASASPSCAAPARASAASSSTAAPPPT